MWVEMTLLQKKMYAGPRARADRPSAPHASAHHGASTHAPLSPQVPGRARGEARGVLTTAPRLRAAPLYAAPHASAHHGASPPLSPQVLVRGLASAPLPSLLNLQVELRKCCNHPPLRMQALTTARPLPSLLNLQIELRKCCNHPFLIRGVEQSVTMSMDEGPRLHACAHHGAHPFPTGDDGHGRGRGAGGDALSEREAHPSFETPPEASLGRASRAHLLAGLLMD